MAVNFGVPTADMAAPATGLPIKFQEVPRALSQPVHPTGTGAPGGRGRGVAQVRRRAERYDVCVRSW